MAGTGTKRTSKRRYFSKRDADAYYAFSIDKWSWDYTFSVADPESKSGRAYWSRGTLHVEGSLSHPHKSAGRRVILAFGLSDDLLSQTAYRYKEPAESVGWLTWRRSAEAFEGVFSMPEQVLPLIVPMLAAGHLKYVLITSRGPYRGHLDVRQYNFLPALTKDDIPEGQW